ncbi:hypothetical protein GCM10011611_67260 [Aliidongia dinghuensis]|uniref:Right-handed parallel beta-helix repeat-containing protein n=1 Tax=Aliidongia dinghuensis TaxID=1867774 RepID=A0A8J2Z218_9PROT|nr:hypothetical protein [Aliidongia dinghuensis]GGF51331.1 hypothetical protein GCM10011611_67260 [Aliidongia dinghuensis]
MLLLAAPTVSALAAEETGLPAYSRYVASVSPATYEPAKGDVSVQFVSPGGRSVAAVVKAPVTSSEYDVPPIAAGETAYDYLNNVLYDPTGAPRSQTIIKFPKGTYDFDFALNSNCTTPSDHQPKYVHWQLPSGATDLVIDGQGSTINFSDFCLGLNLPNVARVAFRNFTFAWPRLRIATVGTVVAVGGNGNNGYTYDVRIDPAHAVGLPGMVVAATSWDRAHDHWDLVNINDDVSYSGDGVTPGSSPALTCAEPPAVRAKVGCTVRNIPSYGVLFKVGEAVLLRHYNFGSAITVAGEDVTFDNVALENLIGAGFIYGQGRGLRLTHVTLGRMAGQPISATGNGSLMTAGVGGDVIIEQSSFAYQGDDAFDLNTPIVRFTPTPVNNTTPMATFTFDRSHPDQLQWPAFDVAASGDTVALFDKALRFMGVAKITSVTSPGTGNNSLLTLDRNVAADLGGAGFIAADLTSTAGARYVIRDSSFEFNRARALLVQTPFGLVSHNRFVGQTLKELYMLASQYWGEGPGAQEVIVSDNVFDGTAHGAGFYALDLLGEAADFPNDQDEVIGAGTPAAPINQNILVYRNLFTANRNTALVNLSSAKNVSFDDNAFRFLGRDGVPVTGGHPDGPGVVSVHDASNIFFTNTNRYSSLLFASSCANSALLDLANPPPAVSILIPIACGVRSTVSNLVYRAP